MDSILKGNIHSPENTRFINGTYYRGRYCESNRAAKRSSFEEIISKYRVDRISKELQRP